MGKVVNMLNFDRVLDVVSIWLWIVVLMCFDIVFDVSLGILLC